MEGMDVLIQKYVDLREQIKALEEKKSEISKKFKAGLEAFGIDAVKVPVGDEIYQLKFTTRSTHSCQWEAFKAVHPDLYTQFVSDGTSEYVDVRAVRNPR